MTVKPTYVGLIFMSKPLMNKDVFFLWKNIDYLSNS